MGIIYYIDPTSFFEFKGGAEINIKNVYEYLKNKDEIILLPTITSIIESRDKIIENIRSILLC